MTQLAVALKAAGIVHDPEDLAAELSATARIAWQKWSAREAVGARRDHVLAALRGDLTYTLVTRYRPHLMQELIGLLLVDAAREIEAERPKRDAGKPAGGGHAGNDTQCRHAPAISPGVKPADDRGHSEAAIHPARPPVVTLSRDAGAIRQSEPATETPTSRQAPSARSNLTALADKQAALKVLSDKQAAAAAVNLVVAVRLSRLDTVKIDGKPIGDCTVAEVKAWAAQREQDRRAAGRDARFALSLVANLPSNAVIREWWKRGDEVDQMYDRAEAEHAA